MAVSTVNSATAAASTSSPTSAEAATKLQATEDRFLKLLVAQLKNQDPMNPLDNAQVTSQMAQLSTVQGVNSMNANLEKLLSEFQGLQAMTVAGRSVLVSGDKIAVDGTGDTRGGLSLAADAKFVQVQVKDATGKVVRTMDLGARSAGTSSFHFDGLDDAGKALAKGTYTFAVKASDVNGKSVGAAPLAAVKVQGVNNAASGITLDLGSYGTVAYADVLQVL